VRQASAERQMRSGRIAVERVDRSPGGEGEENAMNVTSAGGADNAAAGNNSCCVDGPNVRAGLVIATPTAWLEQS
jgi:hypothetical protein